MSTLYLRNVPDDVMDRLRRMAAQESTSVNAIAVRELDGVTRRVDNRALLGSLPHLSMTAEDAVEAIEQARSSR